MRPLAFHLSTAVAAFLLLHQPATTQVVQTRFDIVPIQSGVYKQTLNAFVYTSGATPAHLTALPTVYVPQVGKGDSAYFQRLDKMMQEGAMPYMRIVGIERSAAEAPVIAAETAAYQNPKAIGTLTPSADESYYRFIDTEVIPAIEGKYQCASFKALCIDEGSPFGAYILGNQSRGFNAYLSLTPFVWFTSGRRPESAKAFFAYYAGLSDGGGLMTLALEETGPDELYLKTGKAGWVKQ